MTLISLKFRGESDQRAVREQLDRILKSRPFQQSRRRQRFLEYIVNELSPDAANCSRATMSA